MTKTNAGNFFEDFKVGQVLHHATPRTVSEGDTALYQALFGSRFSLQSSAEVARKAGYAAAPADDFLAFHIVFGKTVPDISLNAVANLGYADCRFHKPVFPGDTLSTESKVIGLKENSNGETGTVYVRSTGRNQRGETVLDYVRWVMVRKRDKAHPAPEADVPHLPEAVEPQHLIAPEKTSFKGFDTVASGSPHLWDDYEPGEKIDHVDGVTIEEAEHMMATRLYQNTAKVHFNQYTEGKGRFGRRLIYGGHVISLARALSFNGLGNAVLIAAINGGRHVAPCFGGDTVFAWSEVLAKAPLKTRDDLGALRIRTIATKDLPCSGFPGPKDKGYDEGVILDLDYWALMPRR
ncbi:MaoC domain protein dehydratase [Parvibaculum lavamentivorans DS-1]|uniref:MaoC domain protein dehydratase n=1 Tax=Parvibaculum lavamentivorans (strain DS-1 / DSM 13023 / NCIMB 13966) TaxID=402881 RepID=A7HT17_PARL1|nr:MaoC family dehydratase [Parvibaculum lavamentivorans]ABS63050.1 MaoC domain protein dehydratase [Parvibaculum lavamentivorans DS-1]